MSVCWWFETCIRIHAFCRHGCRSVPAERNIVSWGLFWLLELAEADMSLWSRSERKYLWHGVRAGMPYLWQSGLNTSLCGELRAERGAGAGRLHDAVCQFKLTEDFWKTLRPCGGTSQWPPVHPDLWVHSHTFADKNGKPLASNVARLVIIKEGKEGGWGGQTNFPRVSETRPKCALSYFLTIPLVTPFLLFLFPPLHHTIIPTSH